LTFPDFLRSNAFNGTEVAEGALADSARQWPLDKEPAKRAKSLADFEVPLDLRKWDDDRVGWGVVAAAPKGCNDQELADNADLPESVRELIAKRGNAPVFRYRPGWLNAFKHLTNYRANADSEMAQGNFGIYGLPKYLLILGGPDEVPWRIQFQLNARRYVGRVPLTGTDLDNYIAHLTRGWRQSDMQVDHTVVWSTDYGYPDITELMANVIAKPIHSKYAQNSRIGAKAVLLNSASATRANLTNTLKTNRPGLIVSTSHGMIGPLQHPEIIPEQLGSLVDQNRQVLDSVQLMQSWQPNGAIWYAHACCSAGTNGAGRLTDLAKSDTSLRHTLEALSKVAPTMAPLPVRLLAAKEPARAFIGHVEPTFDITLRDGKTGELFTDPILDSLYQQLLQESPVGFAMHYLMEPLAGVYSSYMNTKGDFKASESDYADLLNYSLRGFDLEGTVLFGDPTVKLPPLP
jgi:hypothetical protein